MLWVDRSFCLLKGSDLSAWRVSIGLFHSKFNNCCITFQPNIRLGKTHIDLVRLTVSFMLKTLLLCIGSFLSIGEKNLKENSVQLSLLILLIILQAGDVERNPGPVSSGKSFLLSILHCNIRSVRNKLNFIRDEFLDFNILCFTETHLNNVVTDSFLCLSDSFDTPYRKDRTSHGGGILVYLNKDLVHSRVADLEVYCNESIWVKVIINTELYLIGVFYSPRTAEVDFFTNLNLNIKAAFNIDTKNVIILGDLNEDLLNSNFHNLRDTLILNFMINVINNPTRQNAILDSILIPNDMEVSDLGIIILPQEISDHSATCVSIPFSYEFNKVMKELFCFTKKLTLKS